VSGDFDAIDQRATKQTPYLTRDAANGSILDAALWSMRLMAAWQHRTEAATKLKDHMILQGDRIAHVQIGCDARHAIANHVADRIRVDE
jgi:hypothetical protein